MSIGKQKAPLCGVGSGKPGWHSAAVFETPALVAGFDDFAVMGQTVEERRRHFDVAKDTRPFAKGQIGGDE
jgi:hypothetical protein